MDQQSIIRRIVDETILDRIKRNDITVKELETITHDEGTSIQVKIACLKNPNCPDYCLFYVYEELITHRDYNSVHVHKILKHRGLITNDYKEYVRIIAIPELFVKLFPHDS